MPAAVPRFTVAWWNWRELETDDSIPVSGPGRPLAGGGPFVPGVAGRCAGGLQALSQTAAPIHGVHPRSARGGTVARRILRRRSRGVALDGEAVLRQVEDSRRSGGEGGDAADGAHSATRGDRAIERHHAGGVRERLATGAGNLLRHGILYISAGC